jgi:hypothetical protein
VYALNVAQNRALKFTRVSEEFEAACEAQLRVSIRDRIHRLPSVGLTIK